MLAYDLSERAVRDLASARDWYDEKAIDLGDRFLDAALLAIRAARERPSSFPEVRSGVRAVRCRKFPYRVYFEVADNRLVVLAVYHTARDPQRWEDLSRE